MRLESCCASSGQVALPENVMHDEHELLLQHVHNLSTHAIERSRYLSLLGLPRVLRWHGKLRGQRLF